MDPFRQIPVLGIFGHELHIKVAASRVENEPRRIQKNGQLCDRSTQPLVFTSQRAIFGDRIRP